MAFGGGPQDGYAFYLLFLLQAGRRGSKAPTNTKREELSTRTLLPMHSSLGLSLRPHTPVVFVPSPALISFCPRSSCLALDPAVRKGCPLALPCTGGIAMVSQATMHGSQAAARRDSRAAPAWALQRPAGSQPALGAVKSRKEEKMELAAAAGGQKTAAARRRPLPRVHFRVALLLCLRDGCNGTFCCRMMRSWMTSSIAC